MANGTLELDGISVRYRLAKQRLPSFKDYALHWMRGALSYDDLWAVRDVSFAMQRGESVGIVGRNGAGKSTLLKVISGVLEPTAGRLYIAGRVSPMLALGIGFDFELTGQENMILSGLLMGRSRREIDEKAAEIVDFSGLGDFIHTPIRNYSSGMVSRLGFAIVTAWRPDVLILDEVLAVGDTAFLRKCTERLNALRSTGTTLLLVAHQVDAILQHCDRCLWLDQGRLRADGEPKDVLQRYAEADTQTTIRS